MTSATLIIFCVTFFITGSTAAIVKVTGYCHDDAKVALDNDKADIKKHYDNLYQQVQPDVINYGNHWKTVFNPVVKELQAARTQAQQALSSDVNDNCRTKVEQFVNSADYVEAQVGKCWTEGATKVNAIAQQLYTQYNNEMEYLEGYKATVDTLWCFQLLWKIQSFADRKESKKHELTTTCADLTRKINTESDNLSQCVQDNVDYNNFQMNSAGLLTDIQNCVHAK